MMKSPLRSVLSALFPVLLLVVPKASRADNIQVGFCEGAGCTVSSFQTITGSTPISPLSSGSDSFSWSSGPFSLSGTVDSGANGPLGENITGDLLSVGVTANDSSGVAGSVELIVQQTLSVNPPIETQLPLLTGYPLPNLPGNVFALPGSSFLSGSCNSAAVADGSSVAGIFQVSGGGTLPSSLAWSNLAGACSSGSFDVAGGGDAGFTVPAAACHVPLGGISPPGCPGPITNGNAVFSDQATFNFAGNSTSTSETITLPIGGTIPTGSTAVPEPSTLTLLFLGLVGLVCFSGRKPGLPGSHR